MKVGIFGLGLVGRTFAQRTQSLGWEVSGFSRSRWLGQGFLLDASQSADCRRLKNSGLRLDAVVATFPPQEAAEEFWEAFIQMGRQPILLGTTSVYQRRERRGGRPDILESTPLRPDHERLGPESRFLDRGGFLLRLCGIYGGPRNPVRWIEQGRVGYEDRQVNLVHCEDIAAALETLCREGFRRPVYNLSDGQIHTWRQIIDRLVQDGWIRHSRSPRALKRPDAFVDNRLFLNDFPDFQFRDFWRELELQAAEFKSLTEP